MAGWENPFKKQQRLQVGQNSKPVLPSIDVLSGRASKTNLIEFYQNQLDKDYAMLKSIESIPDKIAKKRDLIGFYQPLIKEVLASQQLKHTAILSEIMVWLFDIADIEPALKLAFLLSEKNVKLPSRFDCTLPTFVVRETCNWARPLLKNKQSSSPYLDDVVNAVIQQHWDIPVMLASELFALAAKFKFEDGLFAECVDLCNKAEEANPEGAGVKTLKAKAQTALKK